ncbi:MAG: TonB-dependent receptor [Vicinamibacterales bacterium]
MSQRTSALKKGVRSVCWTLALFLAPVAAPDALAGEASKNGEAFEGRVVDGRTGDPVAGAEITVLGQTGSATTDADGRFRWTGDVRPPFVILVTLPGGRVARPVEVNSLDRSAVLTVEIQSTVTEDVTVAAGAAPSIDASPGAALTMVSARDIAQRSPANLMQAVENIPGVNQVSEGQAAVPAVRGLARGRTLILIDGSRVTSERRVGPSATFLDTAVIEGIDVARGPGSVAYGSDAFGGVISVRTQRPPYEGLSVGGSFTLGAGIPDRRGDVTVARGFGQGGFLATVHGRDVDDYDGPDETVFNSGWSDYGVLLRGERVAGPGRFTASWQSDLGRDIERPRSNARTVRFYYPFENSHRFSASYEAGEVGGLDLVRVSTFLGTIEQRTDQDRFPTASRPRDIERADISAKDFQVRVLGEKAVGSGHVEFGVDLNGRYGLEAHDIFVQYDLAGAVTSTIDNLSVDSARRIDTGLFVQGTAPVARAVSATGGLRLDRVGSVNEGGYFGDRSVSHTAAAGFAAVSAGPFSNTTLTAQVSRGFRDPTISDRFFRGPSGRGFITGNPDLDPETSLQIDLGARYSTSTLRVGAYYYHYRITNLVERYEPEPDFFFFRNRGRARVQGVEFEVQAELGGGYALEGALQVGRGVVPEDGTALDDISPDTGSVVLRKAWSNRVSAFARLAIYAEDDRPGPGEIVAPGHTNLDLGASWFVTPRVELRGAVRNLLNDEYYGSPDRRFVFAPGRNAYVTIAVKF